VSVCLCVCLEQSGNDRVCSVLDGDGGYGLLTPYIGGPAAQADWLDPKVGGHMAPFLYSSREPNELSQWLCYFDSTINIVVVITTIIIIVCSTALFIETISSSHYSSNPI